MTPFSPDPRYTPRQGRRFIRRPAGGYRTFHGIDPTLNRQVLVHAGISDSGRTLYKCISGQHARLIMTLRRGGMPVLPEIEYIYSTSSELANKFPLMKFRRNPEGRLKPHSRMAAIAGEEF